MFTALFPFTELPERGYLEEMEGHAFGFLDLYPRCVCVIQKEASFLPLFGTCSYPHACYLFTKCFSGTTHCAVNRSYGTSCPQCPGSDPQDGA